MCLATHADGSATLSKERLLVCMDASWELDALATLLPTVTIDDTPASTNVGYKVRCIASRIRELAIVISSGLDDDMEKTSNLERRLNPTE